MATVMPGDCRLANSHLPHGLKQTPLHSVARKSPRKPFFSPRRRVTFSANTNSWPSGVSACNRCPGRPPSSHITRHPFGVAHRLSGMFSTSRPGLSNKMRSFSSAGVYSHTCP